MIDRRNKRSVQIFLILITFLLLSGVFFWSYSTPDDEVPDYFPPEVKVQQKTEREAALEKVRQLQQTGFGNVAADTFYDDQLKKSLPGNQDNSGFENAKALFQKLNSTAGNNGVQLNENGEKMTADAFYDEKLKQKQEEEDKGSENLPLNDNGEQKTMESVNEEAIPTEEVTEAIKKQEDNLNAEEENIDGIPRNDTASLDIIGKSEAVQTWLAKKQENKKTLSEVESSLRVDEAAQLSQRRNPKFDPIDPEIERLQNQIHQFKFVQ